MTTHDLIQDQPAVAFAGAQRASKYIEATSAPLEPAEPVAVPVATTTTAAEQITPEVDPEHTIATETSDEDVDLGTLSIAVAPRVAQRGARGMLAKLGWKVGPGPREVAAITIAESQHRFEDVIRQATWTRAVSILIANPKGGVGKTPIAILLGGMLAAVRGGSVCIMEVSDDPGALTFRSEGSPNRGLGELIRDSATIRSAGQLAGYTAPQTSFAAVVGSVGPRPRLEGEDVTAVANVIDDHFSIRVMDSGNQPSSTAFKAAIDAADVLVIPTFDAGDAALEAAGLLDTLRAAGGKSAQLADRAIVVRLHDGRPENPQVIKRVDGILKSHGLTHVHTIPYDPHIAERGQLSLAKLEAPTHQAITATAADVVAALQIIVR